MDNYHKILDDNFNKHLSKNNENNKLLNTVEQFDNLFEQSNEINDIDKINNAYNLLFKKDEINFDNNKKSDNKKSDNKINFDNDKKLYNENIENKFNKYKFDTDEDMIKSFKKIFREKHISYKPFDKSKHKIKYSLHKLEVHNKVPKDLFEHFDTGLTNREKLEHKIPIDKIFSNQDGNGLFNTNKIKINTDLLNKNILSNVH